MTKPIEFGTDGWRAVIADGYTFEAVRSVAGAMAVAAETLQVPEGVAKRQIVVGYDRRFLSPEFAAEVAEVVAAAGFEVLLSDAPTPSQTISHAVKHRGVLGGIIVTASHNPAKYNGLKFKAWYGGSASPEIYGAIESSLGSTSRREGGRVTKVDILTDYVAALREQLDLPVIKRGNLRILHDPIHGAATGIPVRVAGDVAQIRTIRGEVNPSFGGVNPEPIPQNLDATRVAIVGSGDHLAICNDGDADRLGIMDEKGEFVSPHKIISLLALYLVREKKLKGDLVKTFSTTRLIEKIAKSLGVTLHETPIGFKYIADLMLTGNVLLGGEESGGIAFGSFLPERDGILSGLLVAECVAHYSRPLSEIVGAMEAEFGALQYDRRDVHHDQGSIERFIARAREGKLDGEFSLKLAKREEKDGVKLDFTDGTWLLFRKSGTEPIIRIYCESADGKLVESLLDRATELLDQS